MSARPQLLAAILLLAWLLLALWPAWGDRFADTRDYATFHVAVQVWRAGGDPYDPAQLDAAAVAEGTRSEVYPFFYPPPALPLLAWISPFSLEGGYRAMFLANALAALGVGALLWRWFRPPPWLLAGLLLVWTPVTWSLRMGQVNLLVLLLLVLGLSARQGPALALAALLKMSPALLAARWLRPLRARPLGMALGTAVLAHVLILPWVSPALMWRFYTEVLPSLGSGAWNGLDVPIALPANHSLANLWDQAWPGPGPQRLSPQATWATRACLLGAALALLWRGRTEGDPLDEANLAGAWLSFMTLAPVYTWEHHLVFLLPGAAAAATALGRGRLPRAAALLLLPCLLFLVLPIEEFRRLQRRLPELAWAVRESKLLGVLGLGCLNAWATGRRGP